MENNEIIDNQEIDNQDKVDTNAILEENERLRQQVEADKHIKERLAKKVEKPKTSVEIDKDALYNEFKQRQDLETFISQNPHLSHLGEDFKKLTSSGLSKEEAKLVLEQRDPTIAQRQKTESMNLASWDFSSKQEYTIQELEDMPQDKYNQVKNLEKQGKVRIVR